MKLTHAAAAALAALTATGAVAIAKTKPVSKTPPIVKAAKRPAVGKTIVVDARSRTLYRLQGETRSRLLCTNAVCVAVWPPVTVKSARTRLVAGKGVKGKLSVFKRPDGKFQLTLRGLPLYRFAGDKTKSQTNGEGIASFGGTWHVLPAKTGH